MKYFEPLFIALVLCLAFACDPLYDVDFIVENQTSRNVNVFTTYSLQAVTDTNSLSNQTKIILYYSSGIGMTTEKFLSDLTVLPFDSLTIVDGKSYNKNSLDISNWEKEGVTFNGGNGSVTLILENSDFE